MNNRKDEFIQLQNINRLTRNKSVNYEVTGYANTFGTNKLRYIKTGQSQMDPVKQRMYVLFPEGKRMLWHTHPHNAGYWPSFEDLTHGGGYPNSPLNVLFTKYGTWIYNGFIYSNSKRVGALFHSLNEIWTVMHNNMLRIWCANKVSPNEIMNIFNKFISDSNKIGYDIEFVPNFSSTDNNIQNHIKRVQNSISPRFNNVKHK